MKKSTVSLTFSLIGVALIAYQQHKKQSAAPAVKTAYPYPLGYPSPLGGGFAPGSLGGYLPTTGQLFDWSQGW